MKSSVYLFLALLLMIPVCAYLISYSADQDTSADIEPLDLGVYPTPQDAKRAGEKMLKLQSSNGCAADLLVSNRTVPVNITFTSEELTALVFRPQSPLPFSETQIKLNSLGTAEVSGILLTDKVSSFASHLGIKKQKALQGMDYIGLTHNIPFYIQGNISISQQQLSLNISSLILGKISMPADEIAMVQNLITPWLEQELNSNLSVVINSLTIENGILNLKGMWIN